MNSYDFIIKQGAVYNRVFQYTDENNTPINITGYTAKMQIRESHSSDVLLELSTSNGRLSINGVNGTITANVDADVTAALDFETAVWDIELYPAGDESLAISPLFGEVTLRLEVTR